LQLKEWLTDNDVDVPSLGKKEVKELLKDASDKTIQKVLTLRQKISKSSVKKYEAMVKSKCNDGRVRGMFQFYGANRTGRFSSKIVQLQNLPRNNIDDLDAARNLVKANNLDALELLFNDVPDVLSQLIRTAFIPSSGCKFIVSDFSAIEARVIAWYAHEDWRTEAFKNNEDIYCASASQMFGVPVEKHGVNSELRPKGKIAELALGYGGSVGALVAMGAIDFGVKEEELQPLVNAWRDSNPNIVDFWWRVDKAIRKAIDENKTVKLGQLIFEYRSKMLFIHLPSGRKLSYVKPEIRDGQITYFGIGDNKKYIRLESYGPKFVENIVQATARDLLVYAMKNLNLPIVMHIHDEVVIEAPKELDVDSVVKTMTIIPKWGRGLILNADGYECDFYMKD
jgi:DNA polymerase